MERDRCKDEDEIYGIFIGPKQHIWAIVHTARGFVAETSQQEGEDTHKGGQWE